MVRIYPLFSSSKGNSTFIGNPDGGILIDAGVTCKKLTDGLAYNNIPLEAVKAVFITHGHSDHVKGLSVFTKKTKVPVFARNITMKYLVDNNCINDESNKFIISDDEIEICSFKISSFETPHDAEQSCGYIIETADGKRIAVCTDLGYVTQTVDSNLCGCDAVLLESNYDETMLKNGSYPYYLKKRISSDNGHLSNDDCAKQIEKLVENGTTRFILGHLSQENNTPSTAEQTVLTQLKSYERDKDYILKVAPVNTDGTVVII